MKQTEYALKEMGHVQCLSDGAMVDVCTEDGRRVASLGLDKVNFLAWIRKNQGVRLKQVRGDRKSWLYELNDVGLAMKVGDDSYDATPIATKYKYELRSLSPQPYSDRMRLLFG